MLMTHGAISGCLLLEHRRLFGREAQLKMHGSVVHLLGFLDPNGTFMELFRRAKQRFLPLRCAAFGKKLLVRTPRSRVMTKVQLASLSLQCKTIFQKSDF